MSVTSKTCPACRADLSVGTAAMPGVCPACGRDLKLEAIVASLPPSENITKRKGPPPLGAMECALAAFAISLALGLGGGLTLFDHFEAPFMVAMFFVTPHFFLGFFTTGFFTRTVKAQLLWGIVLSLLFAIVNVGLVFVGCSRMRF